MLNLSVQPAVCAVDLTMCFDSATAPTRLSLAMDQGLIFGFLGTHGIGKSTSIKVHTTLLVPTSEYATAAGCRVQEKPINVRGRAGYVPQTPSADGTLTGVQSLELSARLYGLQIEQCNARIAEALEFSGLTEVADIMVSAYSDDRKRRLEIAQATLHYPEVLLLDEPTIGLDPVARRNVWKQLLQLRRKKGMTILVTTHDLEEAEVLCDEVAIFRQGRLAAIGRLSELKKKAGDNASLDEVLAHFSGIAMDKNGSYQDSRTSITCAACTSDESHS